jgi:hypothetical protein
MHNTICGYETGEFMQQINVIGSIYPYFAYDIKE